MISELKFNYNCTRKFNSVSFNETKISKIHVVLFIFFSSQKKAQIFKDLSANLNFFKLKNIKSINFLLKMILTVFV